MDAVHLARIVAEMRKHQKAYFEHRRPSDLVLSKAAEKSVDATFGKILNPSGQLTMFGADDMSRQGQS
jgi:hypothetical protein